MASLRRRQISRKTPVRASASGTTVDLAAALTAAKDVASANATVANPSVTLRDGDFAFGRWNTAERKLERQMILDYEAILGEIERRLSKETHATAIALARLPEEIRGFGHVKLANYEKAKRKEGALLAMLRDPKPARVAAE